MAPHGKGRIVSFKRLTAGQRKARVNMAATNTTREVQGNLRKITRGMVEKHADQLGVPLDKVLQELRSKGANL